MISESLGLVWAVESKHHCCDVAVAQINYPSFKHNTQDSIEQASKGSIPRGSFKSDFYVVRYVIGGIWFVII